MTNEIFRKSAVCGIIILFLGMTVVPPVSSLSKESLTSPANPIQELNVVQTTGLDGVNWTATSPDGMNGWYRKGVTLTCTYDHELIAEIDYRYTGTNWQAYTSPVNITTEGIIEFEWYCVYANGTVSRPQGPIRYPIDRTPPEVEVERERIGRNKIRYSVEISDDGLSGLDRIEFWIGPYLQYTQIFVAPSGEQTAVWILSPVPHIHVNITIKVYDLAGNNNSGSYPASLTLNLPAMLQLLHDIFQYHQARDK